MNKNLFAKTPPMGWNSYDYYDTTVTEEQIRQNAEYMANHMKNAGWEYIVVDIEWYSYDAGTQRDKHQYIPFWNVEMDGYSRLLPCPDRFPSSVNGQGFKPLADYIHSLGLKFGIHIMRGIPREAAHKHTELLGSTMTANEIADPSSICFWNPDMYGVRVNEVAAQQYYDSIFDLYAQWGVDFVKCDDICRMDMSSAKEEIVMMHKAIEKSGREIVFSLSPGPAKIDEAWHYEKYANMWRITDDFWDHWPLLLNMFDRCQLWQNHVSTGCYPDCDMLPVGYLGKGFGHERLTNFTKDEQITMMTLWCIFRSPLMVGAELTKLDPWTLDLLTNKSVLKLLSCTMNAKQIYRDGSWILWKSQSIDLEDQYLAVFNVSDTIGQLKLSKELEDSLDLSHHELTELWTGDPYKESEIGIIIEVPSHGAKLFKY